MSTFFLYFVSILSSFVVSPVPNGSSNEAETGTVYVHIKDLRNNKGQIMISLHTSEVGFPKTDMHTQKFIKTVTAPETVIKLTDIPFGKIAVSMLHDEDNSGKMTFNFFGLPQEGFGFHKNYKVTLRSPSFDEVAFDFNTSEAHVDIPVQY